MPSSDDQQPAGNEIGDAPRAVHASDGSESVSGFPVTDFRAHFSHLGRNLQTTLGRDLTYRELVKYLQGFDDATNVLDGFHFWLVAKLGGGRSLFWSALVIHDALDTEPVHYSHDLPDDFQRRVAESDRQLVSHLFQLLDDFFSERDFTETRIPSRQNP